VRPPVDHIVAPAFPTRVQWINVATLRMDQQLGRPVLIEFWDFCRPNSLRTLPYMLAWHERYESAGLRVIGVHASGFPPSADLKAVRSAVRRLGIPYAVVVDPEFEIWKLYGNLGWPARYLFNADGRLADYHYGEGGYDETELAIREQLGADLAGGGGLVEPLRAEDVPGVALGVQSDDVLGPYSGPYEGGAVWAVLDGRGVVTANGRSIDVAYAGAYPLIEHERHTRGVLELEVGDGVRCHGVCFTPGVDPAT
jgi:thiol-disulfide isomerase/thioredoxin